MDEPLRPFKIINGGGRSPPPTWLALPQYIVARSPNNVEQSALFRASRNFINVSIAANRRQPMLDFWSCVAGRVPPVANIGAYRDEFTGKPLRSLGDAHACYRGLKRPVGEDDNGWDHLAFITKPNWFFVGQRGLVTTARIARVPEDLVFVTYVRLDKARDAELEQQALGTPVLGVVTHWEFVEADPHDTMLPMDHKTRYRRRLWLRGTP